MNDKVRDIAFLKVIMTLIIVLCHAGSFFTGNWFNIIPIKQPSNIIGYFSDWLGTFHVHAFVMASGYIFYYLKKEKNRYNNDKQKELIKRSKRLIIPYIFTSLLWVIPISEYFFHYSLSEIIIKYFLMGSHSQLWFLLMLFNTFAFFLLFSDYIKINKKNLILLYVFTTIISQILFHFNLNYFQIANSIKYMLYFFLGGYLYNNKKILNKKSFLISIILSIIIFSFLIYWKYNIVQYYKYISTVFMPIISLLEVFVAYYVCTVIMNKKSEIVKCKLYRILEDNSFGIYLFHQQIIYFTIFYLTGRVMPVVQDALSFIISTVLSIIISTLLRKNKITKKMFGV